MTCQHNTADLDELSIPSEGDTIQGQNVALEGHCRVCDSQVIIDAKIQAVMSK